MPDSSAEADGELGANVSAGAAMLGPSLQEAVGPLLGTQSSLSSLAEDDHLLLLLLRPFFLAGDAASTDAADFSDALEPLRAALSTAAAAVAAAVLFVGAPGRQEGAACSELGI